MCGVEWAGEITEYEVYDYPTLNCLVLVSEGKITEYVLSNKWTRVNSDFFPNSRYRQLQLPNSENYLIWDNAKDYCKVELRIPVE